MTDRHELWRWCGWPELVPILGLLFGYGLGCRSAIAGDPRPSGVPSDSAAVEFFEKEVRPILATRCQGCHGPAKQKGGLRLDARASALAGGSTGPAVVPGKPEESLLVDAINYGQTYQMPPKSRLPDAEIATLTRWVRIGAPWGVETIPDSKIPDSKNPGSKDALPPGQSSSRQGHSGVGDFTTVLRERARHWCFQPIRRESPPAAGGSGADWAHNPIDGFILAGLAEHGLAPAPEAGKRTLIRRLTFDLTGLPPSPAEVAAFLADSSAMAYERLVDRLLASPHYGERWARHWLDLVRYAETAGHEFDYDIPHAFRYRDYVIRALNADLPYDRFVIEHIAGDLLEPPRRHPVAGFNESILATGSFFLGEGTHSPVDVREDEVRRIDNQIDVLSKAFLGLTVACARCHDHKFDPISNRDYYALAGFLRSSRYQQAFIDPPGRIGGPLRRLATAREEIVGILREAGAVLARPVRDEILGPLEPHHVPAGAGGAAGSPRPAADGQAEAVFEDFDGDRFAGWSVTGDAFGDRPSRPADLRLDLSGKTARLIAVAPGLAHSGLVSDRLRGVLRSRTFPIVARYIHYRVAGRGGTLNVVVDGFEKIRDPIYGGLTMTVNVGDTPRWVTQDVGMWIGQTAYLEIADGAVADYHGATTQRHAGLGYLAVDEIRMSNRRTPPAPRGGDASIAVDLDQAIAALRAARSPLADRLTAAVGLARSLEERIPDPTLALAIADGTGLDEHIHIRGNHKNLGEVVPRRFLEVLGGAGMATPDVGSGRQDLARRMVDPRANPLPARVLVNRLWKHHFGEGIVKSTDDFGAMGRKPSHPELLDWLATELVDRGWSIKALQRLIVTSSTYRMTSAPSGEAERLDPENLYLHRMNVRRLEAEAVRDGLLAASGGLVETMYGPSVPVSLNGFMDGRGRPARSGPLDGDGRRSIYLNVRRNFLNPMFLAFDAPVPFSTMGRRNVSNVPAQALTLMNDPLVVLQARLWAGRLLAAPGRPDRRRLDDLFLTAFGRPPSGAEARDCLAFLGGSARADGRSPEAGSAADPARALAAWADLCHVLINMKEFLFIE
jgi:hypothetical protein